MVRTDRVGRSRGWLPAASSCEKMRSRLQGDTYRKWFVEVVTGKKQRSSVDPKGGDVGWVTMKIHGFQSHFASISTPVHKRDG